jgi:hypothetical protein
LLFAYVAPKGGGAGRVEKGTDDGVSLRRIDSRAVDITYLRGKEVRTTRAVVSKDGATMTSTGESSGMDEKTAWIMVFRKELVSAAER